MESRKFPRVKLKEQSCIIHDGARYLSAGHSEREVLAKVINLSLGGASLITNITSQLNTSFVLQFPNVANLGSFSMKSELKRESKHLNHSPQKPVYVLGLKFIDPDVNLIDNFIKLTSKPPKTTKKPDN